MTYNSLCGKIGHMLRVKSLGLNIKKYREAKKISQEVLAEKLNLSKEYICRVEKGQKYMSLRKLFELADVLEIGFNQLADFQ